MASVAIFLQLCIYLFQLYAWVVLNISMLPNAIDRSDLSPEALGMIFSEFDWSQVQADIPEFNDWSDIGFDHAQPGCADGESSFCFFTVIACSVVFILTGAIFPGRCLRAFWRGQIHVSRNCAALLRSFGRYFL